MIIVTIAIVIARGRRITSPVIKYFFMILLQDMRKWAFVSLLYSLRLFKIKLFPNLLGIGEISMGHHDTLEHNRCRSGQLLLESQRFFLC